VNTPAALYDRLLILRCQAGDHAALAELIARYSPGLRFFLRNLADQPSAADDLLQETWFDVYRKINHLQNPDAFAAWLYRIARDKAYRHRRLGYVDAYVMYKLLEDPARWPLPEDD